MLDMVAGRQGRRKCVMFNRAEAACHTLLYITVSISPRPFHTSIILQCYNFYEALVDNHCTEICIIQHFSMATAVCSISFAQLDRD